MREPTPAELASLEAVVRAPGSIQFGLTQLQLWALMGTVQFAARGATDDPDNTFLQMAIVFAQEAGKLLSTLHPDLEHLIREGWDGTPYGAPEGPKN